MPELIPEQIKGKENNIHYSKTFGSQPEALVAFERAYDRMNDPLQWHKLTRVIIARFLLPSDPNLNHYPLIREGNFFRIEIPGPGPNTGDGYDWVKVDTVIDEKNPKASTELFGMTFRACSNPEGNSNTTAHFFQSLATSTFITRRNYNTLTSSYHGRNEIPNTHTHSTLGNIRNAYVALGAGAGLSETVWSILIKSFLQED